jgi:hypothetical protein
MTDSRSSSTNSSDQTEARGARQRAIEAYGDARTRASDALDEAPLIALAGGLAAGALIAALLPRTRTEEKLLRPVANRAKDTARAAARAATDAGRSRLDELGLTRDRGADAVRSIIDGAREAVRASAEAAVGTVRKGE